MKNNFFIIKENKLNKKNIVNTIKKFRFYAIKNTYKLFRFINKHRKINTQIFKPEIFYFTIKNSSSKIKQYILVGIIGNIIALIFLGSGVYLMMTNQYPATGGSVLEVTLDEGFSNFNPVIGGKNSIETKISDKLFAPLYEMRENNEYNNILLKSDPKYLNDEKTVIEFELKENAQWSNGQKIDTNDIEYSFNRIKEFGGDDRFHLTFQNLTFSIENDYMFQISTDKYVEDLIYNLNFRPVSFSYYNGQKNIGLKTDAKSFSPQVVSGEYSMPSFITNPIDSNDTNRQNPIRNNQNEYYIVSLTRRENDFYQNNSYIENYNLIKVTDIYKENSDELSLEDISEKASIDIISLDSSLLRIKQEQIKAVTGVNKLNTIDSLLKNRLLLISNLYDENIYLSFDDMKTIINCDFQTVFTEIINKVNLKDCDNLEEVKNRLFEVKDTRGFRIFSENKNGKILYYKTPINIDLMVENDVIQLIESNVNFDNSRYVDIKINNVENFEYDNLFINNVEYNYSIVLNKNKIYNLSSYDGVSTDFLNLKDIKKNDTRTMIKLNQNLKLENDKIYINIKRW